MITYRGNFSDAGISFNVILTVNDGNGGRDAKNFSILVLAVPTITSVLPTSGVVGTEVKIEGTSLTSTTRVTFNAMEARIISTSATEVVTEVPSGAASGEITLTTLGGSVGSATQFIVNQPCSFSIDHGSQAFPASGGSGVVVVTTAESCNWIATSNSPWISLNSGFNVIGSGTLLYTVAANSGSARTGTITVAGQFFTVIQAAANNPPTAGTIAPQTTTKNRSITITLTGQGNDPGETISFAVGAAPSKGVLTGFGSVPGTFSNSFASLTVTYTPNTGVTGNDSFSFTVNDGTNTTTSSLVQISINNSMPAAGTVPSQVTTKNVAFTMSLTGQGNDPGETITFAVGTAPTKGALAGFGAVAGSGPTSFASRSVTFMPTLGASGTDSFTFTVNDGSNTVTSIPVSISINNSAPTANAGSNITVDEVSSTALAGATATDPDPFETLTFQWVVVGGDSNGTLSGATTLTPTFTAPDLTEEPSRTVTTVFTVTDGSGATATSSRTITVNRTLTVTVVTFKNGTLTIQGAGFAVGAVVKIGGTTSSATPEVVSSTVMTLTGSRRTFGIKPKGRTQTFQVVQGPNNSNVLTASP